MFLEQGTSVKYLSHEHALLSFAQVFAVHQWCSLSFSRDATI